MKTQEKDKELQKLIKGIRLESPGRDFTTLVMNRVFEEKSAIEKIKRDTIFGKGFWILLSLFVVLMAAMVVFSISGTELNSGLLEVFGSSQKGQISEGYNSFFSNLGTLPLSIGGILFATSLLLFMDKFLPGLISGHSQKHKLSN
jgi:hypothetical protein